MKIRRELSAVLTKEAGSFREVLQHMFYRPAAIQSYRHGHKGGELQYCCQSDFQTAELKSHIKPETNSNPFLPFFLL